MSSISETRDRIKFLVNFNPRMFITSFIENLTLDQFKTYWNNAIKGENLYNGLDDNETKWLAIRSNYVNKAYEQDWIDFHNGNMDDYTENKINGIEYDFEKYELNK
jgi:hypothetical protein